MRQTTELENRNSSCFNPDGEVLFVYPCYTEFRPQEMILPKEVCPSFPTGPCHEKRLEALRLEQDASELLPGEENDLVAIQAVQAVESRLYPNQAKVSTGNESKRGSITCVSQKSSIRLKKLLGRTIGLDLWIDLTFADDVFENQGHFPAGDKWLMPFSDRMTKSYECLNKFERVIKGMGIKYVWKKEIQTRKSGDYKGARIPHYHVCLVGLSQFQKENWSAVSIGLLTEWVKITGTKHPDALTVALKTKNGVPQSYRRIESHRTAIMYIGKYFSKTQAVTGRNEGSEADSIGRAWGYSRDLPLAEPVILHLATKASCQVRRSVKRLFNLRKNDKFIGLREQLERGYATFLFINKETINRLVHMFEAEPEVPLDRVPF